MNTRIAGALALAGFAVLSVGQATVPATRPSSVGKIASSLSDLTPLEKGNRVPKLTLKTADGTAFDLLAAVARKPTVLLFYRGGWCPYCIRQLSGMEGVLQELTDAGYQLLAISPDKPEELAKTRESDQLTYTLLSDADATAIRAFGLAYQAPAAQFKLLEQYSGATHHALPESAVYILGTDGIIKFVHLDPDFRVRMTPSEVLEQAKVALPK